MMSAPRRAISWLRISIVVALAVAASPALPGATSARAQSALYPGAAGFVANTGGEAVLLRETPSFDAAVLSSLWEGTPADVVEGPVYGADGVAWYGVVSGGVSGYIVAGYLQASDGGQTGPAPVELAQEATYTEPVAADPMAVPDATWSNVPANPYATADLNLRAGPGYDNAVLLVIPAGAPLAPTGEWAQGFAGVTYEGTYGWVDASWLGAGDAAPQYHEAALMQETAPALATVAESAPITDPAAAPAGQTAYAVDVANLRLGPSEGDAVLRVLPAGGAVTMTGPATAGWTPVWYNGTWGFISSPLLSVDTSTSGAVEMAQQAAPLETVPADTTGDASMLATTLSDVNLRGGPDLTAPVLGAIPAGVALEPLAGPESGYYQVQYGEQMGWVAAEYLQVSATYLQRGNRDGRNGNGNGNGNGKVEGSEPASNADANANLGAGGIIWPVSGGLWYIMQGYNGSSHQNQDGLYQYQYSLDLARRDGNTAGQPVISPVNGVVRWTDPGTGGISIDIGNGHAVAMFHVTFMAGLQAGTPVQQGQYLGEISGPGGPGFAGTPHVHFTLWTSSDNGNWDRQAVPFTGQYAIAGLDFPGGGSGNQYAGTEFSP
jgi:uncharacterized protein YraI